MNSLPTNLKTRLPRVMHALARCAGVISLLTIALGLAPCCCAQSAAQRSVEPTGQPPEPLLYSMKFEGRDVESLAQQLKSEFPSDNVVVAPSAKYIRLDAFEVRNVRLHELGKTIEFLSEGRLTVEVIERGAGAPGNLWHIGTRRAAGPAATASLKMRSVAAPNLFSDEAVVKRILTEADSLEDFRLKHIEESAMVRGGDFSGVTRTQVVPLPAQNIFVLVGSDEGIAGVESFLKAAEQLAVEQAAEKRAQAASFAPQMRAVVAPHLFASEEKLSKITAEFNTVQTAWDKTHARLTDLLGVDNRHGEVRVEPHPEQKLFVLYGSTEGIAGMESLILAAEKNAAEEDAQKKAFMTAREAEENAQKDAAEKAE